MPVLLYISGCGAGKIQVRDYYAVKPVRVSLGVSP